MAVIAWVPVVPRGELQWDANDAIEMERLRVSEALTMVSVRSNRCSVIGRVITYNRRQLMMGKMIRTEGFPIFA